jgi:hypothetical protein
MIMMQEFWGQRQTISISSSTQTPESRPDRWVAADLGFFDPGYDGKTLATAELMQHADKDTFFRDVHLFIDRAKDIVVIKGAETVRNNLYTCLRDCHDLIHGRVIRGGERARQNEE